LFGYSLVLQVAEISGFFVQSGLLFVAGLLSVPGFRHVGAQGLYEVSGFIRFYKKYAYTVMPS
jgi:hypothetical protein